MKKLMIGVVMMVLSAGAFAQNDAIAKFFNKYQEDETFSVVNISGKMFSMMANVTGDTPEEKAIIGAISKIKGFI